jgi:nucleoside 2-deoxyribosyltransferase
MKRFEIYLIGGMTKIGVDNFEEGNKWRVYLKDRLETCNSSFKVHVVNPNDYYNCLDDSTYDSQREIMEFDLHKVRNSDLCICNFNDPGSLGSMGELAIAYDRRIPVVGLCENNEELHPWQEEMITKKFVDKEALASYVIDYYLN